MKRASLLVGLVAVSTLGVSAAAYAGYKETLATAANQSTRHGDGALGSARNSADSVQYIGCSVWAAGGPLAYCYARNSAGTTVTCQSSDPSYVAAVQGINSDSKIYFDYDATGVCTNLYVHTYSYLEPKKW